MNWEDRFAGSEDYLFGRDPVPFLRDNPWLLSPPGRMLCVADGEGRNAVHLARHGLSVTTFDMSETAVGRARELAREAGVSIDAHISDWQSWNWEPAAFDAVFGLFIQFAPPDDRARQFDDMARTLKPGGRLVLHGYRPEQIDYGTGGPPDAANMYTPELMRDAFAGWQIERLATYDAPQQSGTAHVGMSALLDFVARKPG